MIDLSQKLSKNERYAASPDANYDDAAAQTLGAQIDAIRRSGEPVTPEALVCVARDPRNPIHEMFDWDNTTAANKWRNGQARYLIRNLRVVTVTDSGVTTQRAEYSLPSRAATEGQAKESAAKGSRAAREYFSVSEVRETPALRSELIAQAVRELRSWVNKYQSAGLSELSPIFEAASDFSK